MGQTSLLRLRFGAFDLDEADARLKRDGKPVALPPKAFGVLCALARQPGVLVTKNALLDAVWGHQHVSESVLKTTISQVRAALADDAANPRYIETASRLGYRFIGSTPAAPVVSRATPVPAGGAVAIPEGFVGRRDALAKLHEYWAHARQGQRHLVFVAGDAGVGKSTLLETFVRASGAAAIAQGQCVEQYGSGEPYLPVLQALGDLCREYADLPALMRAVAPTWLLQLPWLASEAERAALARELVGVSQERMVREFHELIARFTTRLPLLFVIEDLHWSDEATLRLMDHFARQRGPANLLWIGSFRLTQVIAEGHPLQGLRQELRLHRLAQEIVLDPFSETEVAQYLRGRLPADAGSSESFVRRVHAHTDGLPLFVVNVVDAVLGQGAAVNPAAPLPVPEDLAGAVETRIGKLPADAVALLEVAAVCGVEFRAGVVAAMCGLQLPEVIAACDRLVRGQFWLRHSGTLDLRDGSLDASYSFRHAIYRHVFYQRLGAAARMQAHRNAAKALAAGETQGVPVAPAELASHHERGREAPAALRAYAQAVQTALRSFAPVQALELAGHARGLLAQVPAGREQLELELGIESGRGIAAAQVHGVGSAESRAIFERVRELCELLPRHPARALLLNGYGASLYSRAEYDKLEQFAELLEQLDGPDRAPLVVMTAFFRAGANSARGRCRAAAEWWLKAIELCEGITDRRPFQAFIVDPEVGIRANSVRTLFERGLYDQARAQSRKAHALADAVGQPLAQSLAHWRAGMLEIRFDNPERVLDHAAALERIVTKTSVVQGEGPSLYLRGWALARLGDAPQGLRLIRDGLDRHLRIGMISSCTEVMGYAAEALILAQEWTGASEELARAFARTREIDEHAYVPALLLLQARVARGQGDEPAAYRCLHEARRVAREQESLGFELKAAVALGEHAGATTEDRASLTQLLGTLTEGPDSADVMRARALIR